MNISNADTTAISSLWTEATTDWTVSNSLSALGGATALIAISIVVGLVFVLAKRMTKRLSKGKGGL